MNAWEFMARQADSHLRVIAFGAGDVVHDALQFCIASGTVDQAFDLNGDKHLRHAVLVTVVLGDFRD
ncbi:hypothetical protein D3C75_1271490 [compost metagenome]